MWLPLWPFLLAQIFPPNFDFFRHFIVSRPRPCQRRLVLGYGLGLIWLRIYRVHYHYKDILFYDSYTKHYFSLDAPILP